MFLLRLIVASGTLLLFQVLIINSVNYRATNVSVLLGAHRIHEDENTQIRLYSSEILVHPEYNATVFFNDLSLIKLPEAVALNEFVNVVKLPEVGDNSTYAYERARVSGWGLTDGFVNQLSDVLNYVDVVVDPNYKCIDFYGPDVVQDSTLCTSGEEWTGSCNGDSGGPLVLDGVQIGTVSFGVLYCFPGYPSGYSRVSSNLDWILENTDVEI